MKHWTLLMLLTFPLMMTALAGETIGEVAYVEGKVTLTRNGSHLRGEPDFGTLIENLDLLSSGSDGFSEVVMDPDTGMESRIRIDRNSSFYFEVSRLGSRRKTVIELLAGSVSLTVKKLAGRDVEVRTASAIMGVRGTEFTVTTAPGGEILVTCSSGSVECEDTENRVLFARPGYAVEKIPGERFREIPVAVSSLEDFRSGWIEERIEVFTVKPLQAIEYYAGRYTQLRDRFHAAYGTLMDRNQVIEKWMQEDQRGRQGGRIEVMREKKSVVGPLLELRKTLSMFERVYYRLQELHGYYRQGYGSGILSSGESTGRFFRRFEQERDELAARMSMVRYVTKLYAERNDGSVPGFEAGFTGSDMDSDSFFDDADSFFD